ncbi:alpha/beta fold hydrolase [Salinicoccus roseus]|uniref:alpha/beta fold hydrolase n=1 Tax=Salinicoccus roseus TaxID=45670 RepID=UPI003DA1C4F6
MTNQANTSNKPERFSKENTEVFTIKEYIEINDLQQGMIIESENIHNPVLLFLHGGPGMPEYPIIKDDNLLLHEYFTVCYWDQRGSGMSFCPKEKEESLTFEQLIKDTVAVTKHLCEKFNKEKVYLFGHSWGTFLGIATVSKFPEYYHAYIGSGQLGNAVESEKETLRFLKDEAKKRKHKKVQEKLQNIIINQDYYKNKAYLKIRGKYVSEYGGGIKREGITNSALLKQYFLCKPYTLKEKINIFRGAMKVSGLMDTVSRNSLIDLAPKLNIPIYIFQGKFDYATTYNQAKIFFDQIEAPSKKFYTFEHSAHSPFLEEKELFYDILEKDVLSSLPQ